MLLKGDNKNIMKGGYKIETIHIEKTKDDLNDIIKKNHRGWGYTIF